MAPQPGDRRLVYRTELTIDSHTAVSTSIVEAVATAADREPVELPPFQRSVDVDALNELFSSTAPERTDTGICFSFEYAGYGVTIFGDGIIEVYQ